MRTSAPPMAQAGSRPEEGLEEYLAVVDMEIEGDQGARGPEGREPGAGPGAANG